ncbi:hypothetical protein HAX54_017013 [Datura stramonium]|uniref:Uncharacterized protein n=1 Tax=Datura stramonium TaxID=4076 RepID=A0ABS8S0X9_DATST|nr:hypothetical protein [Datura stramonium]
MGKICHCITTILDKIAKHNHTWHAGDASGGVNIGAPSMSHLIKENQERDQMMETMDTNIALFTNRLTKSESGKVLSGVDQFINDHVAEKEEEVHISTPDIEEMVVRQANEEKAEKVVVKFSKSLPLMQEPLHRSHNDALKEMLEFLLRTLMTSPYSIEEEITCTPDSANATPEAQVLLHQNLKPQPS